MKIVQERSRISETNFLADTLRKEAISPIVYDLGEPQRIVTEYVLVSGLRIRYTVSGSGPPVVLIHGLGEFLESWLFNIRALGEYFTVYALDLPGSGMSEGPKEPYTFSFAARFVVDFMKLVGVSHASLVGHSLGGFICLSLTASFPEKVDNLVLVATGVQKDELPLSYRLLTIPFLGNILLGPPALANEVTMRFGMRRQFYRPQDVPLEWIDIALKYFKMPERKETIVNFIKSNNGGDSGQPISPDTGLQFIQNPILFVHGLQDRVVPVQYAFEAASLLPHARLVIFDECGHNPQIEKPEAFHQSVVTFLRSVGV